MSLADTETVLAHAPLGKRSTYINIYSPNLLFPIARKDKREELQIFDGEKLPFKGWDIWNGFELSWLNSKGRPVVAVAEFIIPCESKNIIESKSFKLYLNSFNNSRFESTEEVKVLLERDLLQGTGLPVHVKLFTLSEVSSEIGTFNGVCLDELDIECDQYLPDSNYLNSAAESTVEETLYTHLLKSNCLVTGQPDWASVQIEYKGPKISHEGLLKYLVSMRDHNEFHEQCVERIFIDILRRCKPEWLTVYARYTRRGGLDINPYRTNKKIEVPVTNIRLVRQ